MRLELDLPAGVVTVRLSRRNLLAFLAKLGNPEATAEIWNGDVWYDGVPVRGLALRVIAEEDALHYGRRPEPAGIMSPATEAFIAAAEADPTIVQGLLAKEEGAARSGRRDAGTGHRAAPRRAGQKGETDRA